MEGHNEGTKLIPVKSIPETTRQAATDGFQHNNSLPDMPTGEVLAIITELGTAEGLQLSSCGQLEQEGGIRVSVSKELFQEIIEEQIRKLGGRFKTNPERHGGLEWQKVYYALKARLIKDPLLWLRIYHLERTEGEPDVYRFDNEGFDIGDCSKESPPGRRNVVYDDESAKWLKRNDPQQKFNGNAMDTAARWGVQLMIQDQYSHLQRFGEYDRDTISWLGLSLVNRIKLQLHRDIGLDGYALSGDRNAGVVQFGERKTIAHFNNMAWRGTIWIPWAK